MKICPIFLQYHTKELFNENSNKEEKLVFSVIFPSTNKHFIKHENEMLISLQHTHFHPHLLPHLLRYLS